MIRKAHLLICPLAALFGCAAPASSNYIAYEGTSKPPVSTGAFVDRNYAVPIYYGYPTSPYEIMGYLSVSTAPIMRNQTMAYLADEAKKRGGDALIFLEAHSEYRGTITNGGANTNSDGSAITNLSGSVYQNGDYNAQAQTSYSSQTQTSFSTTSIPLYGGQSSAIVIFFSHQAIVDSVAALRQKQTEFATQHPGEDNPYTHQLYKIWGLEKDPVNTGKQSQK